MFLFSKVFSPFHVINFINKHLKVLHNHDLIIGIIEKVSNNRLPIYLPSSPILRFQIGSHYVFIVALDGFERSTVFPEMIHILHEAFE